MTQFVDANVVIRYLTNDPPELADRAAALLEGEAMLTISPLIIAEVGYVLTKVYGREPDQVVAALIELLQRQNISVHAMETDVAVEALELCRPSNRISFADALLRAEARTAGATVRTFDARFPKQGVPVRSP